MSLEKQLKIRLEYSFRSHNLHRFRFRSFRTLFRGCGSLTSFQRIQNFIVSKTPYLGYGVTGKGRTFDLTICHVRKFSSRITITHDCDQYESLLFKFDAFLPLCLRSQRKYVGNEATAEAQPIQGLARLLIKRSRESSWKDVSLSQLGLRQNRWPAFLWLVQEMIKVQTPPLSSLTMAPLNGWAPDSLSLYELTSAPSLAVEISQRQSLEPVQESLSSLLDLPPLSTRSDGPVHTQDLLGYLLMCLGSVIIDAVKMVPEAAAIAMANVYQAIASMHHQDLIPRTIYNYSTASDASAILRPPTLRLLHSRILTTLSDAAWTASEAQVLKEAQTIGAKFVHKGHELPGAEFRPRVRSIGLEIWLEFILWSCIESGRIKEASWIINQIQNQEEDGMPWRAASWEAMQKQTQLKLDSEMSGMRKQFIGAASTAEGYSEGKAST